MKVRDDGKKEEINPAVQTLEDLPVVEEQSEDTKGAGAPNGRLYLGTDHGVFGGAIAGIVIAATSDNN